MTRAEAILNQIHEGDWEKFKQRQADRTPSEEKWLAGGKSMTSKQRREMERKINKRLGVKGKGGPMPQGSDKLKGYTGDATDVNPQREPAKGKKIGKTGYTPRGFAQ